MEKLNISCIAHRNSENGYYFWSCLTNSFFKDSPSNWNAIKTDSGRVFIIHKKKGHRLQGQVREVFDYEGECMIGTPLDELFGMTPKEINKYIS